MKRRGIKNLIIDFGGVLIDLDRQRCLENFRKLGLPDVEVMLDLYHQQDFFQKYEKGLITSAEFREVIRGKIGKPVTDAQIDDAWNSFLVSIPTFKLDLLLELRKKYVVYLLSNTNEIHWQWSCLHAFRSVSYTHLTLPTNREVERCSVLAPLTNNGVSRRAKHRYDNQRK